MPLVIWVPLNHMMRNLIAVLVIPRFSASSTLKSFGVSSDLLFETLEVDFSRQQSEDSPAL